MTSMTASALLKQVRAASGEAGLTNLAPIVLAVGLAEGVHPDDPSLAYTQSMTVSPAVHPTLAALLDYHGATRRGRASWQVGYGRDTPHGSIGALLDAARPGTIWWKDSLLTRRKRKDMEGSRANQDHNAWTNARHQPVGHAFTQERTGRHNDSTGYRHDRLREAKFGIIALNDVGTSLWMSVHTTQYLTLPDELQEEIGNIPLDLWQVGAGFREPIRVYPAQALAIAEWAQRQGLGVWDPENTGALARFKATAGSSVVAWPRRGRPAQATISVGAKVPKHVRERLLPFGIEPYRTSAITDTDSTALAETLADIGGTGTLIHPAVLDAAALAGAEAVGDESLRDHQQVAVARHLATDIGYVNASSPGLGKTVMVLYAMAKRAQRHPGYRGLAVVEANVRDQWCQEAAIWFPAATTVRVESRADAAALQQTLEEAGPFPVLVVTSYALASDVMRFLDEDAAADVDIESDRELDPAELEALADDAEELREEPAAPAVPAPVAKVAAPAPARELPMGEPGDLLELLNLILAGDQELEEVPEVVDETDAEVTVPLGTVLLSQQWHDLIADEAVCLRTTGSAQSKAMWALRDRSQVAVALTGTPIKTSVNDLGALVAFVRNDRRMFRGVSLDKEFDLTDDQQLADFTAAVGAILFRRDKSEIEDELPDVSSDVITLEPSAAERALANAARNELKRAYDELLNWLDAVKREHADSEEYAAASEALKLARYAWLGGTTLARMAASDPAALLEAKGAGAALLASQGLIAAATQMAGTKRTWVVTDTIARVQAGERLLIFTEFATVARGLIADLDASGVRVGAVLGGGGAKRDRHVAEFRAGELDVLVLTSAGQRGLNLQTATTVVHYDLPWTPEGIIQRSGRVERIGATADAIKILFPVMAGTIEERVASVVVSRAAVMMRALDTSRGVKARSSDVGRALGSLAASAKDSEVTHKEAQLLQITRDLLAA